MRHRIEKYISFLRHVLLYIYRVLTRLVCRQIRFEAKFIGAARNSHFRKTCLSPRVRWKFLGQGKFPHFDNSRFLYCSLLIMSIKVFYITWERH